MGEYALYGSHEIKIGTCEDMLYLRFQDRGRVTPLPKNVDPTDPKEVESIRFRFPFPDEDGIEPGGYKDPDRGIAIPGYTLPDDDGYKHGIRQFSTPGYNVCLPCPESKEGAQFSERYRIHRNGWPGAVQISQHRLIGGTLFLIVRCTGCGRAFRLPWEEAEKVIVCLRSQADQHMMSDEPSRARYWNQLAERIAIGYPQPADA